MTLLVAQMEVQPFLAPQLPASRRSFIPLFCCCFAAHLVPQCMNSNFNGAAFLDVLGLHWGHIGDGLGTHWDRIGDTLGTLWGRIGDTLGTDWVHIGEALGTHWGRIWDALGTY